MQAGGIDERHTVARDVERRHPPSQKVVDTLDDDLGGMEVELAVELDHDRSIATGPDDRHLELVDQLVHGRYLRSSLPTRNEGMTIRVHCQPPSG